MVNVVKLDEGWPATEHGLVALQQELGILRPAQWHLGTEPPAVGACFVCFPRNVSGTGVRGERAWAAAVVMQGDDVCARSVVSGAAGDSYQPGMLALREGALLQTAVSGLGTAPAILLVNATGRDHPRRAGLAVHLGVVLDVPTIGVTDRTLVASGALPADEAGQVSPLTIAGDVVGYWLRSRVGVRPVAVHAGWRVDADTAVEVVRRCTGQHRTPLPLREARRIARRARSESDT